VTNCLKVTAGSNETGVERGEETAFHMEIARHRGSRFVGNESSKYHLTAERGLKPRYVRKAVSSPGQLSQVPKSPI